MRKIPLYRDRTHVPTCQKVTRLPLSYRGDRLDATSNLRLASIIISVRIGRFSRGPVPNASKRQFGSANLGSPGPLYDKATQGCQSESCLGGWRCKDPSEEVDRRRRGWTAYRKISRPSARSRARAKDGSGSHSELLSRMDGTG